MSVYLVQDAEAFLLMREINFQIWDEFGEYIFPNENNAQLGHDSRI